MLSGTISPVSMHYEIIFPISGLLLISFLSRAFVEICTRPKVSAKIFAWVDLPEPGGPTTMTLGGLFGALLLNLMASIFSKSGTTSLADLS